VDETTDMVSVCWRAMHFFAEESCGQCTPCREGTGLLARLCKRIDRLEGHPGDIELMSSIADGMAGTTICALGDAAAWPALAFITKFRDEFEAKLKRSKHVTGAATKAASERAGAA